METTNQPQKITDTNFLFLNGNSAMAGPLNMSNNKITHLANPTANGNAINNSWSESSAVARPNGQPRQAGVAREVRGHAPPPEKF